MTSCKRLRREKNEKRMQNDEKSMDCGWIAAGSGNYLGVSVPPSMMIALRFGIAALISGVILRKHLRGLTRGQVLMGLLVGVLTGLAYIVQTIGLQDTTAGKNAFLTTIYVLLVPFGSAVLFHEKLGARRYVAAVLMLLGIGILSLDGESGGLNRGDVLTLVCGVLYAAQIISVGRCNERMDT